jgi:hemoglobin
LTEQQLTRLVERFYAKVRQDDLLGPVFNGAIVDWPEHLEKLSDFWSSVMLTTGRYKGRPMAAHVKHKRAIKPEMFERWLGLWRETAAQVLDDENTIAITAKAERIAESLQLGMFFEPKSRGGAARKEVSRGCSNS